MQFYSASNPPSWTLANNGLAFVPNAVDRDLVGSLRQIVDSEYARIEQPSTNIEREISATSASWGGIAIDHVRWLAPDPKLCVSLLNQVIAQLSAAVGRCSAMNAAFEPGLSYIRRHKNSATFAPWHLDAHAAGTIQRDPVFNAWMPLVPVGSDCPSLEFIVGAHRKTRAGEYEHQQTGHPLDPGYPTAEWIEQHGANGNHICLFMEPGDVVIFDHWTPHRTQVADFAPYIRTSAEMRFHGVRPHY
jgi:ectoine hydroxylase-related dioxygenase (phytanoyl-CoA dioxygenase family)